MTTLPQSRNPQVNFEMETIRRRQEAAQKVADKLGVTVGRVLVEWRESEERQKKWSRTLVGLGYKPAESPKDFLHRINSTP